MIATTRTSSPRNKTGLFVADALKEAKSEENRLIIVPTLPPQNRNIRSAHLLLALSEQKHHREQQSRLSKHELQQDHPVNQSNDTTIRIGNAFRPSTIRRQKLHRITNMTHRDDNYQDLKDLPSKQSFATSPASARLKSEIDQISNKLKLHDDPNKLSRFQQNQDVTGTPVSSLSYFTSYRPSSASTSPITGRITQHPKSTMRNGTTDTVISNPEVGNTSKKSQQTPSAISVLSPSIDEDYNRRYMNHHVSHAYQIPQRSNIGSESNLSSHPPSISSKKRSTKNNRPNNEKKSVSCPFYVMYFTNLTMQKRPIDNANVKMPSPTPRKETVKSRISTTYSRHSTTKRQVGSPISMNSRSTIDDDDDDGSAINTTAYYNNKRFSAKITAFENENSHLLKDVLRTTAWNHVQI